MSLALEKPTDDVAQERTAITVVLPPELRRELSDALLTINGSPHFAGKTLRELVIVWVERGLEELRADYNKGKPFARSGHVMKAGRPVGTTGIPRRVKPQDSDKGGA